jgi:chromosomal replication initiation ATPase DnaA
MGGCTFVALLEREQELAAAAERLARARAGAGSLLLVEGPPGIGKTALLDAIRPGGMARLSARADELEREFAYGVVRKLFEPALRRAGRTARGTLLDGAARFAAPAVGAGDGVGGRRPPSSMASTG